MASLETRLQNELNEYNAQTTNRKVILPSKLKIIDTQVPLYSASYILTKDSVYSFPEKQTRTKVIGRIDFTFTFKSTRYVCEIKDYTDMKNNFWGSVKTIAYTEYYKWQSNEALYKPAVLVPANTLRMEHQIISRRLGIMLLVFSLKENGVFEIKIVDDTPHWKQNI